MELDTDNGHLYAVGSRSHVTFVDSRVASSTVGSLKSIDTDCGKAECVPYTILSVP